MASKKKKPSPPQNNSRAPISILAPRSSNIQSSSSSLSIPTETQKALSSLSRTSYSTWGFPVLTSCLVYTAILRSLLSYTVGIWFNPLRKSSNISSLSTFHNKCLRLIGDAFKATPSFLLESELFLLPLDLYFKFRTVCFLSSIQTSSLKTLLHNIFSNISHYTSSVKKPLKKFSTISLYWKFTWLN